MSTYPTVTDRDPDQHDDEETDGALDETPAAAPAAPVKTARTYRYETREAGCEQCGEPFTSKRYSDGWTRYCSSGCGGAAARQRIAAAAAASATPATTAASAARIAKAGIAADKWELTPTAGDDWKYIPTANASASTVASGVTINPDTPAFLQATSAPSPRRALRPSLHTFITAALPDGDTWTADARARFLATFTGLLDTAITTDDEPFPLDWRVR